MAANQYTAFDEMVINAAREAVAAIDPAELGLLDDMLNPPRRLFRWRRSDAVGFGAADAAHWVAPYAVAAALWYGRIWYDEGKSIIEVRTRGLVRRLAAKRGGAVTEVPRQPPSSARTIEVTDQHTRLIKQYVIALGLDEVRAELLAHAIVGVMIASAERPSDDQVS